MYKNLLRNFVKFIVLAFLFSAAVAINLWFVPKLVTIPNWIWYAFVATVGIITGLLIPKNEKE